MSRHHPTDVELAAVNQAFTSLSQPAPRAAAAFRNPKAVLTPAIARTDGLTEAAHAERFARTYGGEFRYDCRRGVYLVWDRYRWREDTKGLRYCRAVDLARELYLNGLSEGSIERREAIAKWAIRAENRQKIENTLALASHYQPIADRGDDWDADPWVLNTPSGLVDLHTGTVRESCPDDRVTLATRAMYPLTAKCPRWTRFLTEVFPGDPYLVPYVHRAVGYSLTGQTREQVLFLGIGGGCNGKGTFLDTLAWVLGDYSYVLPFSALLLQHGTQIGNDLAALVGRRFVIAQESSDGKRFDEAKIKGLTGCDPVTARYLYHEPFTFQPVAHFWLACNHKPVVRDDSYAFWRRIRLIPFAQTFALNQALEDELRAEADGILKWAVDGCLAWQQAPLSVDVPRCVLQATGEYQVESDVLAEFLESACDQAPTLETGARDLYEHYKRWCEEQGLGERERLTGTAFGRKITERFRKVRRGNTWFYQGIAQARTPSTPS